MGIPFGAGKLQILLVLLNKRLLVSFLTFLSLLKAYFPISWSGAGDGENAFPLPGKEIFGLRLFIFSTVMCQIVLTFTSSFVNPIGLQIVENIPFFHSIALICFQELGYGMDALSNLLLILALTSILVGISFYILGAFGLGRGVYFIPKHVLGT